MTRFGQELAELAEVVLEGVTLALELGGSLRGVGDGGRFDRGGFRHA